MNTLPNLYTHGLEAVMSLNLPIEDITSMEFEPPFSPESCVFEATIWVKGGTAKRYFQMSEKWGQTHIVTMSLHGGIVKIALHTH